MRKIEFNELKLKNINDEETFYQAYLKKLQKNINTDNSFNVPIKQYEIFFLNILGGKLILLNKDYINNTDNANSKLFYDYSIALKVYNLMLDIIDGIEAEGDEFNELYKNERLQKDKEIEQLKKQDDILFQNKQDEYDNIMNTDLYNDYLKLKEENKQLKFEIEKLKKEIKQLSTVQDNNSGFLQRLINKFKNKKLLKD